MLLSIKPQHVDRILDGTKTVELRRHGWRDALGATALLYSSGPRRALVGSFVVAAVDSGSPTQVWRKYGPRTAVTKREFDEYFAGSSTAVAVVTSHVRRLPEPLTLEELRRRQPAFLVPQSYRYVDTPELGRILNGERPLLFA
jgi:predicted transcriptional regulator